MSGLVELMIQVLVVTVFALPVASLQFSPPLSDNYVVIGNPFWWTCSVLKTEQSAQVTLTFVWRFQNADIGQDGTRIAYGNGTLYFPQVLNSHIGQYTCIVNDTVSRIESSAWLREVNISTSVQLQPSNQSVEMGGVALWDCKVDGQPLPRLSWAVNGVALVRTLKVNVIDEPGHSLLKISNISYTDAGSYTCTANQASLAQPVSSAPSILRVYGKPELTVVPVNQTVPIGYNVTFYCRASSEPNAIVMWLFQSSSDSYTQVQLSSVYIDTTSGTLHLLNVGVAASGTYSCSWSNEYGSVFSNASLVVAGMPEPPVFVTRPEDTTLTEGNDLHLFCTGSGNPKPYIFWINPAGVIIPRNSPDKPDCSETQLCNETALRSGNNSDSSGTISNKTSVDDAGSLTLKNVNSSDAGIYICRLVNPEGLENSVALISILYKPYFIIQPQSMAVKDGSQFVLSSVAVGNPQPVISWSVPGNSSVNLTSENSGVNSNNNEVVLDNGYLLVTTASTAHRGMFTSFASNSVGSSSASATVSLVGVPYFVAIPVSQGVIEGDNVILECQVEANPTAQVYWYYQYIIDPSVESTDITYLKESLSQSSIPTAYMTLLQTNQSARYSFVNGTSLQFAGVQGSDAGLYVCLAVNDQGSAFETAILRVITYPEFLVKPIDTKVVLGSTVRLDCFSVGIPIPSQRWNFNHRQVDMDSRKMLYINGSLSIGNLQEGDLGNYTCFANNQAGQRSRSAILSVAKLPLFLTSPSNTTVVSGSTAVMICRGSSSTSLQVSWYVSDPSGNQFNIIGLTVVQTDQIIYQSPEVSRVRVSPEGDLVIGCAETTDSTWYLCSLENSDGNTSSSPVFLTVNELPSIIATQDQVEAIAGESVNMTCQARGSPLPIISWLSPVKVEYTELSTGDVTIQVQETSQLVTSTINIHTLQVESGAGVWSCKACNVVGCRLQRVTLTLEGPPVIRQIIGKENNNSYFISCIAAGSPVPNITYASDGIPITNSTEGHTVVDDNVWIEKEKIQSNYTCQAANLNGSVTALLSTPLNVNITNARPMSNSLIVSLTYSEPIPSLTPSKVVLSVGTAGSSVWQNHTFNLSPDIQDYLQVEMDAVTNNDTTVSCQNVSSTRFKRDGGMNTSVPEDMKVSMTSNGSQFVYSMEASLQGLNPNTAYVIEATMANILGSGPLSPQVKAQTLQAAPSAVTNVTVEVKNSTATVSWTKPDPINGLPEDTYVSVQLFNSSSNTNTISVNVLDISQVTFRNLQTGEYNLRIFVFNRQTNTTSSIVAAAFNIEDHPPSYITNITDIQALNAHVVDINWTVPSNPNTIFPPVTGYIIEVSKLQLNDSDSKTVQESISVNGRSVSNWRIESLLEQTTYSFRVASRNTAGIGPYSEFRNVTTPMSDLSEDPLESTISLQIVVIIVAIICAVLVIVTVVVIVIHQIKISKSSSVDLNSNPDSLSQSNNIVDEEMQHDGASQSVQSFENPGFILY